MSIIRGFALALTFALVSGCASMGFTSDVQKVEVACASVSTALKVLTVANNNGKLSVEQQAQVTELKSQTDPICSVDPYPSISSLKGVALTKAAEKLTAIAAKY